MVRGGSGPRIAILGAGPAGLGAAHRLQELGHSDYIVLERNSYPGGLSASFVDERGFTWDIGGHVQFSHYDYFDRLMQAALGDAWLKHQRCAYIRASGRLIPYPFQNNIRHLPPAERASCILGLMRAKRNGHGAPRNFRDWILRSFGEGMANAFFFPYNSKVWGHPLETMSHTWIDERVAQVDVERVVENVLLERDDPAWGPNSTFRFPLRGGTGGIWRAVAGALPRERIRYSTPVTGIDLNGRRLAVKNHEEHRYDALISTIPLDVLARLAGNPTLAFEANQLSYSSVHVVGLGVRGPVPDHLREVHWMYFPEEDCPFYRATVFSNYSPHHTPDAGSYWSLMAEVSESAFKPVDRRALVANVVEGLRRKEILGSASDVVSVWNFRAEHGYPVPTLGRDGHVEAANELLERHGVYSRGRFGAWKYEAGNQDHACMQGVEAVNRILHGQSETTCLLQGQLSRA